MDNPITIEEDEGFSEPRTRVSAATGDGGKTSFALH